LGIDLLAAVGAPVGAGGYVASGGHWLGHGSPSVDSSRCTQRTASHSGWLAASICLLRRLDALGERLMPVLSEVGIEPGQPDLEAATGRC
jgi:hypothetical protein